MTEHLVAKARVQGEAEACFWTRGLIPAKWVAVDEPLSIPDWQTTGFRYGANWFGVGSVDHPLFGFGDASGGIETSHPILRRVGVGLAVFTNIDAGNDAAFGLWGAVPGSRQVVARGELQALRLFLDGSDGSA
eukprot:3662337-Pyramimonas_sp.AAC.1